MEVVKASLLSLLLLAVVYSPLERMWPARRQQLLRPGLGTDFLFLFGQHLLFSVLALGALTVVAGWVRGLAPAAGVRSNVIVGFPGETEADLETLCDFLTAARMDVTGVFGYSDEDGTEAASYDGKLDEDEIRARVARVSGLVEELASQRAAERIGEEVVVLVETVDGAVEGRAAHQGPEVDGTTRLVERAVSGAGSGGAVRPGDLVRARVVDSEGADLVAEAIGAPR